MLKRIAAIAFIFVCTSAAWMILAASIWSRTNDSTDKLTPNMASIWGTPQEQWQPQLTYPDILGPVKVAAESTRVNVELNLKHRQKGLLWYSTYVVDFDGVYVFKNSTDTSRSVSFQVRFPSKEAIYDGLSLQIDGQSQPFQSGKDSASVSTVLAPGQAASFRASYKSQGLASWRYKFGDEITQTRNFALHLKTNFEEIDFPLSTLAPTEKHAAANGWDLDWRYTNLISGFEIGMAMPEKPQPGPLAGEISYFAPVSLLLYFFVMFILATVREVQLHPMNYFFLAASFFAFHLLLAYSTDHIPLLLSFGISSIVSVGLAVSYLKKVVGWRFAIVEAGIAQTVYLVCFSSTFFLKGFTGLAITTGCILTLFFTMQITARIRWSDLFAAFALRPQPLKV